MSEALISLPVSFMDLPQPTRRFTLPTELAWLSLATECSLESPLRFILALQRAQHKRVTAIGINCAVEDVSRRQALSSRRAQQRQHLTNHDDLQHRLDSGFLADHAAPRSNCRQRHLSAAPVRFLSADDIARLAQSDRASDS
ncbi:hypothetical protein CVT26_010930 [Gymnopilus dilepis]|uniref:Uncharacterized protein n=1 Tax=Gymnopilus dilepis TaxID=231916 RepID=A0A409VIM4_9AGAR|nr:hypothetical protein CVT26_010930 [Gymnopilus dilepis]